ncbi:MAG TPA: hypothetical protein VFS30_11120 [Dehalococcoidia bacterium]|nr:hypothetical protein [Dehalococcoidia bacterium]
MTTATIALTSKMRPDSPAIVDVVSRAREGDRDALVYVFDNVFYDVYHHVLMATHSRQDAQRITRDALDHLPSLLRRGHYGSVEELRRSLVIRAEKQLHRHRKADAPTRGMDGLRAAVRHAVLISSTAVAATGALLLVT